MSCVWWRSGFEGDKLDSLGDLAAKLELELFYDAASGCGQEMLHLHRFEDENRLVCLDKAAGLDQQRRDTAGHRRSEASRRLTAPRRPGNGARQRKAMPGFGTSKHKHLLPGTDEDSPKPMAVKIHTKSSVRRARAASMKKAAPR